MTQPNTSHAAPPKPESRVLKSDLFGQVCLVQVANEMRIYRDTDSARWWVRWIARWLARREARALECLQDIEQVPGLLSWDGHQLQRQWIGGEPMQIARPKNRQYFAQSLRLLRLVHRRGVAHNDTAKEPNWLVRPDGSPALIDFQVAMVFRRRNRLFRLLAREDLRHLLKHKRTYAPEALTQRQLSILASPGWISRWWMLSGKRLYLWFTRGILGWADREGAGDRNQG